MYNQSKVGINPPTTTKRPEFPIVERGKNKEKQFFIELLMEKSEELAKVKRKLLCYED